MERNAGPMTDQQVDDLTDFLQDPTVRTRLSDEEGRRRMLATATLEPASASLGRGLFHGQKAFRNGGPNCAGCHAVDGLGGTLAVDLTTAFSRFGEMGLKSALEKPTFPTMMPIYAAHPLTSQEAAHVTAFLEGGGKESPSKKSPPVGLLAGGMAVLMIGLLAVAGIRKRPGVRARLIREANRR
jgi:mono/diheme cytochrome c family protein